TLDLVWDHLLPAVQAEALKENPGAHADLQRRLSSLALRGPDAASLSPTEASVSGRIYEGQDGEFGSMSWSFSADRCLLSFRHREKGHCIEAGRNRWQIGDCEFENGRGQPVAAWGSWTGPNSYEICLQYLEEPASTVFTANFDGDRVSVATELRGRFVDPVGPSLQGSTT